MFGRILDIGFVLILILRPKTLLCFISQSSDLCRWSMEFNSGSSRRMQSGSQTHPVVIFPLLECLIRIVTLRPWQNPHLGFLTCEKG